MQTFLVCEIRGGRFAFVAEEVAEVTRIPWVTTLAETPPDVRGVVNYRGQYVAVVDPALRLTGAEAARGIDGYLIVVGLDDHRVALVVDRVDNLVQASMRPTPDDAGAPPFVHGHFDDARGVTTVLDVSSLLRPESRAFAARARDSQVPAP